MAGNLRLEKTVDAMGCSWSFVLYGGPEADLEQAFHCAARELRRTESELSVFKPDSEWSRINRQAFRQPVDVSPESLKLLTDCLEYHTLSDGTFDVSIGGLVELWGFARGHGRIPDPGEVSDELRGVGAGMIIPDPGSGTVRLRHPRTRLDPGGIGKGYAVDLAVRQLRRAGVESALVSAGSSTIFGMGSPPDSPEGWAVLIHDPRHRRQAAVERRLKDRAVSTSGAGARVVWSGRKAYTHILDPRTGYPVTEMLQVSVSASRAIDSEAWSKPCFILGPKWAADRLPQGIELEYWAAREDPDPLNRREPG